MSPYIDPDEDLVPGKEYVFKEHLANPDVTLTYVGPDNGGYVFRHSDRRRDAGGYRNFTGSGVQNLRPKPEPFFEVGKAYRPKGSEVSGFTYSALSAERKTFTVSHVDSHPDTGVRYAHGWLRDKIRYGDPDEVVYAGHLKNFENWEEVA